MSDLALPDGPTLAWRQFSGATRSFILSILLYLLVRGAAAERECAVLLSKQGITLMDSRGRPPKQFIPWPDITAIHATREKTAIASIECRNGRVIVLGPCHLPKSSDRDEIRDARLLVLLTAFDLARESRTDR